jgi:hypothetical protein
MNVQLSEPIHSDLYEEDDTSIDENAQLSLMFTRFRNQVDELLRVWDGNVGNVRQPRRLLNFRGVGRIFEELSANLHEEKGNLPEFGGSLTTRETSNGKCR